MSESFPTGRFLWFELLAADPAAAKPFYTALTGWVSHDSQGGDIPYTEFENGETSVAGMLALPAEAKAGGAQSAWLGHIGHPDVDAAVARAVELGATVMAPVREIPTVGRFAVLRDPQGATFAIYTPEGEASGHDGKPEVGEFSWKELITTDHTAAFEFYSELFGWKKLDAMDMGPAGIYQLYGRTEELPLGGMMTKTPDMPMPPSWVHYIRVPDVHAAAEQVKQLGGQVAMGPHEVPGGDYILLGVDPQGAHFALHSSTS